MFCRRCGHEVGSNDTFCPSCGERVADEQKEAPVKEVNLDDLKPVRKSNGMAIAGFVCAFFIPLLGWIFGGVGLRRAGEAGGKGKGFAIAAIVIATVMFFVNIYIQQRYGSYLNF